MRTIQLLCSSLLMGLLLHPVIITAQVPELNPKTTTTVAEDSIVTVEILPGVRKLEFQRINDSTNIQILAGNVRLKQGNTFFECDSCVINNRANVFEAWGNVHINDSDTANAYSSHLRYLIDRKIAYLDGGVRLTDGKGTLTTPNLEYDVNTKIGIYNRGGTVVNKKSVLTSTEGYYYTDLKDIYFKGNVELKDPAYYIKADSLLYNTETQTTRFIAETYIRDSAGRVIKTREGYYNQLTGKAEFGRRPQIIDEKSKVEVTADNMVFDDSLGISQATGNVVLVDTAQGRTILAGKIWQDNKKNAVMAVGKPLMILKQDEDSIFITADTLFSARLTDLYAIDTSIITSDTLVTDSLDTGIQPIPIADSLVNDTVLIRDSALIRDTLVKTDPIVINDSTALRDSIPIRDSVTIKETIPKPDTLVMKPALPVKQDTITMREPVRGDTIARIPVRKDRVIRDTIRGRAVLNMDEKDSTNRYFEAYRNVRVYSDSMQAVCDSLFYSYQDSIFRMYYDPVIWSKKSQITGDTVLLFTKNKKADRLKVFENSFMVNYIDPEIFNQVKATRMDGFFKEGNIDSVRARGFAQAIYYLQDEDSAYTGVNETKSDAIDIYFKKDTLQKVVFRSQVTGTIWPIKDRSPQEMRLEKFRWLEARRPKSRLELFE